MQLLEEPPTATKEKLHPTFTKDEAVFKVGAAPSTIRQNLQEILGDQAEPSTNHHVRTSHFEYRVEQDHGTYVRLLRQQRESALKMNLEARRLARKLRKRGIPTQVENAVSWNTVVMLMLVVAMLTFLTLMLV